MTEHTTRKTDAKYDTTKYGDFNAAQVMETAGNHLLADNQITSEEWNELASHFMDRPEIQSAQAMVDAVPEEYSEYADAIGTAAEFAHIPCLEKPVAEQDPYDVPYDSFGLAVVRVLAGRDEWGAIQFTAENAADMSGIGPVGVAEEIGVNPDPADREAAEEVADAVVDGYEMFAESWEEMDADCEYGPSDRLVDEGDGDDEEDDEEPDDHRLNPGIDRGNHLIYGELGRIEAEGVHIDKYEIVHTDGDDPDLLKIHYSGVSVETIEELRYQHLEWSPYFSTAWRPLSEIETL